jgi:hypothetical protein
MEATIEWLPGIILPTPFDVQKRIQELRGYPDPNDPTHQPEAYAIYGNIYTTFGLGVRHTGHPGRPARPGFSAGVLGPLYLTLVRDAVTVSHAHLPSLAYSLREVSGG